MSKIQLPTLPTVYRYKTTDGEISEWQTAPYDKCIETFKNLRNKQQIDIFVMNIDGNKTYNIWSNHKSGRQWQRSYKLPTDMLSVKN